MNIAIVGYGRMGKEVEKVLLEKNIKVIVTIDKFNDKAQYKEINSESLKGIDVVIDFSSPDASGVVDNIKAYVANNVNVVLGTTGWYEKMDEVKKIVDNKIGLIWSGNFSLGVNIFFKLVKNASKIFDKFEEYDAMMYELHHNQKKDSPSGTAKMIANIMLEELKTKNKTVEEKLDRKIEPNEIHVASVRGGKIPGTHVVMFDSAADTIELKHSLRTREGLAVGAVKAAQWIYGKKGFFSIDDFMDSIIKL
jgi:4-hydroxy-tetrahydrodipicolinate reductase